MEGNSRKEDKTSSPSTSSAAARQDQPFADSDIRAKQYAQEIGVSKVLVLGMEVNGVTYQGVLLPQKECKSRKT
ncbi:hypothetical protein KPH14_010788 [Odynerus spinipes]|uniref:Uncharacterized protein n=1 Tax=Odynerus spinipes TaxID=1348599 RepID=A0AAD9RGY3_9HYME|nr:hypothetical protein KPH14_010788 [Odynerus spinipes]